MNWVYKDGGRALAGYKGEVCDCVTRAIAIATGIPYKKVYRDINRLAKNERTGKWKKSKSNARLGVYPYTWKKYLKLLGWKWTATMGIGTGCKVHLKMDELPLGIIIVR